MDDRLPPFREIARGIMEKPRDQGGLVTGSPSLQAQRDIVQELENCYLAGRVAGENDRPAGSLVYTGVPSGSDVIMPVSLTVLALDLPDDAVQGFGHFALGTISIADRATLRAACAEMLARLDTTERLEQERANGHA